MYFHSIIDTQARCDANVVDLRALTADLKSKATTRSYNFITPNLCHDGHDEPCTGSNEPGGLVSANAFLKTWIPKILESRAYRDDGLVIVTFDEAENHDASACCGEQQGPNTPNNGGPTPGAGGGRVGAVLLSRFIKPGTVSQRQYNHYSMLRSLEDLFGLAHLGYAGASGLRPFGADIYTNPSGTKLPPVRRPTVQLTFSRSLEPCTRTRFWATADATGRNPRIVIKRDGVVVATKRGNHLTARIHVQHVKPGSHVVSAIVTDAFGRKAAKVRRFERCAPPNSDPDSD
jgi:hypothetical protein